MTITLLVAAALLVLIALVPGHILRSAGVAALSGTFRLYMIAAGVSICLGVAIGAGLHWSG